MRFGAEKQSKPKTVPDLEGVKNMDTTYFSARNEGHIQTMMDAMGDVTTRKDAMDFANFLERKGVEIIVSQGSICLFHFEGEPIESDYEDLEEYDSFHQYKEEIFWKNAMDEFFNRKEEISTKGIWHPKEICLGHPEIMNRSEAIDFIKEYILDYFRHAPEEEVSVYISNANSAVNDWIGNLIDSDLDEEAKQEIIKSTVSYLKAVGDEPTHKDWITK